METFKDIKGYEDKYQVSDMGTVRSLVGKNGNKTLKQSNFRGYLRVRLYKKKVGYKKRVSRLVAQAFIPNLKNKPQVNHINEIKTDNNVHNLEWMTAKENNNHGTRIKRQSISMTNGKLSKKVNQYDKNNNFIKEWPSMMEAERWIHK